MSKGGERFGAIGATLTVGGILLPWLGFWAGAAWQVFRWAAGW